MSDYSLRTTLHAYTPPEWTSKLHNPPQHRLKIAELPTPIRQWNLPGLRAGYEVSIKRDDLTGAALSGNKIRKLEFLMADAIAKECDSVVTVGPMQSNHCRATAVVSRQLGLQPHLFLRSRTMETSIGSRGNLLLVRLVGAQIIICPYLSSKNTTLPDGIVVTGLNEFMEQYTQTLRLKGSKPYFIPDGGFNSIGFWGHIEAFKELMEQGVLDQYDDIVMAVGSGGTVAGLSVGNYLTGSKLKIHGVCVCQSSDYFYSKIDGYLKEIGLLDSGTSDEASSTNNMGLESSRSIMDLIDEYKGNGYAESTDEELKQLVEISSQTGILLDRVYTVKAVRGLLGTLKDDPTRFKGKRILFLHTGGIHSLFDGRIDEVVKTCPETSRIHQLSDFIIN